MSDLKSLELPFDGLCSYCMKVMIAGASIWLVPGGVGPVHPGCLEAATRKPSSVWEGVAELLRARGAEPAPEVVVSEEPEVVDLTEAERLRDLAERLRGVPVTYGVDEGDIDLILGAAELLENL